MNKTLYNEIMERGKTSSEDAKILGVVVHGTKEELIELINNPLIKATSFDKTLYNEIMERGKTSSEDAKILGVVVHGTKEELIELINNPLIKATSFGVITDPIY